MTTQIRQYKNRQDNKAAINCTNSYIDQSSALSVHISICTYSTVSERERVKNRKLRPNFALFFTNFPMSSIVTTSATSNGMYKVTRFVQEKFSVKHALLF